MNRLFRFNSSVSSRSNIPRDIIKEENFSVEEIDSVYFNKWSIQKMDAKSTYKISWPQSIFKIEFNVKIIEQIYVISKKIMLCAVSLYSHYAIDSYN